MFQKTPLILQFKLFYGYKTKHPIHQNNGTSHEMPLFLFYMVFLFYSKWFCTLLVTTHNTPKPSCEGFSIFMGVNTFIKRKRGYRPPTRIWSTFMEGWPTVTGTCPEEAPQTPAACSKSVPTMLMRGIISWPLPISVAPRTGSQILPLRMT